jgi:hypothetical protein
MTDRPRRFQVHHEKGEQGAYMWGSERFQGIIHFESYFHYRCLQHLLIQVSPFLLSFLSRFL